MKLIESNEILEEDAIRHKSIIQRKVNFQNDCIKKVLASGEPYTNLWVNVKAWWRISLLASMLKHPLVQCTEGPVKRKNLTKNTRDTIKVPVFMDLLSNRPMLEMLQTNAAILFCNTRSLLQNATKIRACHTKMKL